MTAKKVGSHFRASSARMAFVSGDFAGLRRSKNLGARRVGVGVDELKLAGDAGEAGFDGGVETPKTCSISLMEPWSGRKAVMKTWSSRVSRASSGRAN